ncbi:hypothetical protein BD779DRAFT_1555092 [Infundibulicybe gibba]|nr:hypothetical protein BD779DRAFT_1555092 [Infundibulicybe gibba]
MVYDVLHTIDNPPIEMPGTAWSAHNTNPAALPLSSGRPPPREAYPIVPSPPASG